MIDPKPTHEILDVVVGAVFVLFYSAQRFNTPSTNRSSTTWGRYLLGLCPYCLVAVATYLFLVEVGTPALVGFLGGGSLMPKLEAPLSNPLLMALMMTSLLPRLPLLSAIDQWVYKQLQEIAAIPYEVRRLSAVLGKSALTVADEVQADVSRRLRNDGIEEQDIRFTGEPSPPRDWTLLTALLARVDDWRGDRRMARYLLEQGEALQGIDDRYRALLPKARSCFKLLQETRATAETDKARFAIQRYADDFVEQVSKLREDVLAFIARGILQADLTDGARNKRLAALGLPAELERPSLTSNQLISLFGVLLVLSLSASVFLTPLLDAARARPTTGVLLARAGLLSLVYTVAVGCAVFPKQRWTFAMRKPGQPRPFAFYVVTSAMAVVIAQALGFGFNCVLERSATVAASRWLLTYPWAAMTAGLTLVTAILVDDQPPARWPRWLVSVLEGLCMAAVMVLAARLTVGWLAERWELHRSLMPGYSPPSLLNVAAKAGAVGFLVGFLVPRWYRDAPRAQPEASAAAAKACADVGASTTPAGVAAAPVAERG
jgi:hypothetical protein